jgi:hypothetical protein
MRAVRSGRTPAESKGFEPLVPLQVHLISNPSTTDQDAAECEKSREIGDPSGPQIGHPGPPAGQSWGNPVGQNRGFTDPVDHSLAKALEAAAVAQDALTSSLNLRENSRHAGWHERGTLQPSDLQPERRTRVALVGGPRPAAPTLVAIARRVDVIG